MENSVWDMTLAKFLEDTASHAPTPGGGSVTMVSASLGLGLVIMALEISLKKKASLSELGAMEDLLKTARQQIQLLTLHVEQDIIAFKRYMEAISLPKQTPAEKIHRQQAIQQAILAATSVPLAAARDTLAAIETTMVAAQISHAQVISDVGAGAALLGGAIAGVLLNVDINLPHISDPEIKQKFALEKEELAKISQEKVRIVLAQVQQRIAKN
jgi:formiminotetrahydrofolate cyclodeaminase